jgi:hypothetical protein
LSSLASSQNGRACAAECGFCLSTADVNGQFEAAALEFAIGGQDKSSSKSCARVEQIVNIARGVGHVLEVAKGKDLNPSGIGA